MKKGIFLMSVLGVLFFVQSCETKKENADSTTRRSCTNMIQCKLMQNLLEILQMLKLTQEHFQIKPLKYGYDELNEYIDAKTMEVHFSKHYLGYINKIEYSTKRSQYQIE